MKNKVFFTRISDSDTKENIIKKFALLLDKSNLFSFITKKEKTAIKIHFGEESNTGFVKPEFVRVAVDRIISRKASVVITDTNTLYRGKRLNSADHLKLAQQHGFVKEITGAETTIAEDSIDKKRDEIKLDGKFIKTAKIPPLFRTMDAIIGIAHFKGHMMTGFGGALKNIGMGCATREGKLQQHSDISPLVILDNCKGCEECIKACPVSAISMKNKKSNINSSLCIGCASCIAVCPFNAIEVNWASGADTIQEKMVEYAKATVLGKEKKMCFINFLNKITAECDCLAKDDPKISPDIGIFASTDPVGIDKASFDMVVKTCHRDVFKDAHPQRDGSKQLKHAEKIGLGSLDYELIEIG